MLRRFDILAISVAHFMHHALIDILHFDAHIDG
jgi:hypothetical protein